MFCPGANQLRSPWIATTPRASQYLVSGVTRDTVGTAKGGCTVQVFETLTGILRGTTISDANGNYAVEIAGDRTIQLYATAYLAGSPDIAGMTVNTLIAS